MVLGNGFISYSSNDVLREIRDISKGKDIRVIPLPTIDTMTYYISDIGEVYGCQKMKNMYLTKPLRIENRYSLGSNFRYVYAKGKQKAVYMQYVMYCTFVLGYWDEDLKLEAIDGNVYNYQLDNIKIKGKKLPIRFLNNMSLLKDVYKSHFNDVAWYSKFIADIDFDDCKDIASNAFYEICGWEIDFDCDLFVGLWKNKVRERTLDFIKFNTRFKDVMFGENGEELMGECDKERDVIEWRKLLNGTQRKKMYQQWLNGDTPTDIAEDNGVGLSTVSGYITRFNQILRNEYRKDILILNS